MIRRLLLIGLALLIAAPAAAAPSKIRVSLKTSEGVIVIALDMKHAPITAGKIELTRFPNAAGLESIGNSRYRETELSQGPITGAPNSDGRGTVYSGWLEASNVDIATEMTGLVMAKRGYQLNLVAYKTIEEMLSKVNQIV